MLILAHVLYWVGAYVDWVTTVRGIESGRAKEGNPVLAFIMRVLPWRERVDIAIVKVGLYALLVWVNVSWPVLAILGGAQLLVGALNWYRVLRK